MTIRAASPGSRSAELVGHGSTPSRKTDIPVALMLVDPEVHQVFQTVSPPRAGQSVMKAEAALVGQWERYLAMQGHTVRRGRISIDGERGDIITDTYDLTSDALYEARNSPDRSTVRLAIGQLFDYLRFFEAAKGALLLPTAPSRDAAALIESCGFGLVYRELGSWKRFRV